jgi:hypothetical protein
MRDASNPRLRCSMNIQALDGVPQSDELLRAMQDAGYDGV